MNKDLLITAISKLLNLAESEKEFAFRTTIEKVAARLQFDEALRIDELGVFQLKKEPLPRYERTQLLPSAPKEKRTLVYTPPFERLEGDIKSLFLTLDLDDLNLSFNDDIDKVFSISVNKPLIPIADSEKRSDGSVINSDYDVNSDLEERIHNLVAQGIILENYDVWEDYLSRSSGEETSDKNEDEGDIDLNELMKDDLFDSSSGQTIEQMIEELEFSAPNKTPLDDDLRAFEEIAEVERKFSKVDEDNTDTELKPFGKEDGSEEESFIPDLEKENDETEHLVDQSEEIEFTDDTEDIEDGVPSNLILDETTETMHESDEEFVESELKEEVDDDKSVFDELEEYLKEDKTASDVLNEIDDQEKPIIKEEESDKNLSADENDEEEELIDKDENEELISESSNEEYEKPISEITENESNKEKAFYKKPIFIYSSIAAALVLILLVLFLPSEDSTNQFQQMPEQVASEPVEQTELKQLNNEPIIKDSIVQETAGAEQDNRAGLYREIKTDVQAANQIYYDGESYSVQVSSWRSAAIAEREVNRLKNLGHDAFIYQVFLESKGSTWNRVRIGYFKTLEDAEDFLVKNKF